VTPGTHYLAQQRHEAGSGFLQYNSPYDTDILQEYFVPVAQFVPFTDAIRAIFLNDKVNLLRA
jgi:hypothetical protein